MLEIIWIKAVLQILLISFVTERLLDGIHKFYLTKRLKEYLIGNEDEWTGKDDTVVIQGDNRNRGIVNNDGLREFISCKFCQSWWVAWIISLATITIWEGFSLHWFWMGLVAGGLANKIHDLGKLIRHGFTQ